MAKERKFREIGLKIKELRSLLGSGDPITQEALGARLGVPRSQISSWEVGKEKPGGKKLIALAREAPDPENLYFWQLVGIDPSEIEKGLRAKMVKAGERVVFPEMSRISKLNLPALVERLSGVEIAKAERPDYVLLPSRFVPEDPSVICMQVPPHGASPQFSTGDLVLIDTTQRDLDKYLNCFVALAREDEPLFRGLKPEIVRLLPDAPSLTERDKKEIELNRPRDPLLRAETDRANEELWRKSLQAFLPDISFGTLRIDIPEGMRNLSHEGLSKGIPWRLILDGGTSTTLLTVWNTEELRLDGTLKFPEGPKICVLGVVMGWLRAPRISASRLPAAEIEAPVADD